MGGRLGLVSRPAAAVSMTAAPPSRFGVGFSPACAGPPPAEVARRGAAAPVAVVFLLAEGAPWFLSSPIVARMACRRAVCRFCHCDLSQAGYPWGAISGGYRPGGGDVGGRFLQAVLDMCGLSGEVGGDGDGECGGVGVRRFLALGFAGPAACGGSMPMGMCPLGIFLHAVVALELASTGCLRIGFLRLALELACASGHCGLGACEPRVWCGVHVCVGVCGVAHV